MKNEKKTNAKIALDIKEQIASLTRKLANTNAINDKFEAENKVLRKQNVQLASILENDLTAEKKLKIKARSKYSDADLDGLTIEQLTQIELTLDKSMSVDGSSVAYKSIRAGDTQDNAGQLTVGSLYGKTRDQILKSGGDF